MEKFNLDDIVDFYIKTINVPENTKVNIGLTPLDINQNSFDNKMVNDTTTVKKYQGKELAKYPFIPRDIIKELKINEKDVFYIKGWIDANNDEEISVEYNEEVVAKIVKCYCYRDFTVDEVKKIVKELRDSEDETKGNYYLWIPKYKSSISPVDKTYETTTKELNQVMDKYKVNTCLRKIHFLAQTYHETDRFRAMTEYTSKYTPRYDPFRGRGLIHLTHSNTYEKFQKYMKNNEIYTNPSIVATNIKYAFEAAGWFWENIDNTTANNKNINMIADTDDTLKISQSINGKVSKPNGLEERIKYVNSLKKIFKYEQNH